MTDKSHVGILHTVCEICTKQDEDQDAILFDRTLKDSLVKDNYQWGRCKDCQEIIAKKMIALIEIDETKTVPKANGTVDRSDAYRTGRLFFVSPEAFQANFNQPMPANQIVFIDTKIGDAIMKSPSATNIDGESGGYTLPSET